MKANPICEELENVYIFLFKNAGCEVELDDEGIHASISTSIMYIMDDICTFLRDYRIPHSIHVNSVRMQIIIRERYFEED